ncbi:hypothetical protein A2291_06015 [candidate division WOR-1 bacterium RIFOXYB2_FULL_42_35]|uniref:Uncharacterized protein n=1 Tax=candidate division WOR-1 bacterium RIFOXYC2_FULL_41_25 TaxID=1802586 RepID=A0A1F4TK09_UNCSA|nr:MAG: hypothetical protein A2247_01675 [candidate division WOR-1 bacterium RIFOXYA2_FULL_41_14]OGC22280.1 MAG: hypothetical protein A2291_06015 [candidate division WOR-1 bacterium RIFOXYB2_FULL_42_35]OGC32899.1 MAG: hypothetical protein A2462_00690 [candidate division WOR-1 bacterium RIFOXYC2_FULL_41_25]
MGEYIKNMITGEEVKIGVLDHCFFSRQQIKKWLDDPAWVGWYAGKEEEGTLRSFYDDHKTLYDKIEGLNYNEFAIKVVLDDSDVLEHQKVHISHKGKRGSGYHYAEDCQFKGKTEIWLTIVGERYDQAGEGRTIFACDCCEAMFSLPQQELNSIFKNIDQANRDYLQPILKGRKDIILT